MANEQWLSLGEATAFVRARLNCGVGRAQAMIRQALASGEVRKKVGGIRLMHDDGVVGMHLRSGVQNESGVEESVYSWLLSKDDLTEWFDHNVGRAPARAAPGGNKKARAAEAIDTIWKGKVPDQKTLPNDLLLRQVADWLHSDCGRRNIPFEEIGRDTVLRAAGRRR